MRQGIQAFSPHACEPARCGRGRLLPLLDLLWNWGGLQRHDGSLLSAAARCAVETDDHLRIRKVTFGAMVIVARAGMNGQGESGSLKVKSLITSAGMKINLGYPKACHAYS